MHTQRRRRRWSFWASQHSWEFNSSRESAPKRERDKAGTSFQLKCFSSKARAGVLRLLHQESHFSLCKALSCALRHFMYANIIVVALESCWELSKDARFLFLSSECTRWLDGDVQHSFLACFTPIYRRLRIYNRRTLRDFFESTPAWDESVLRSLSTSSWIG